MQHWPIGNHARRCFYSVLIADWSMDSELREVTSLTGFPRLVEFLLVAVGRLILTSVIIFRVQYK